jgi:Tol biopolymer transport system component
MLPDGKSILYVAKLDNIATFDDALIIGQRLDNGERKIIVRGGTSPRYLPSGHLVYIRGSQILAVPFDAAKLEVTGAPVVVESGGWMNRGSGGAMFDVANTGTAVFAGEEFDAMFGTITIGWLDRKGAIAPLLDTMRAYQALALSPDGQKIAMSINAANNDLWVYHMVRGVLTRITFGGGNHDNPRWSPDGRYIYYAAEKRQQINIFRKPWDGSGEEERITTNVNAQAPVCLTADGTALTYGQEGNIWVLPFDTATGKPKEPYPLLQSPATELGGWVSPDGRWIAYTSNESNKRELFVTSYPKHEGKWQISTNGSGRPFWNPNGKELLFLSGSEVMAVNVLPGATFDFTPPVKVCDIPARIVLHDISSDGQRFLITNRKEQTVSTRDLQVVTNWFDVVRNKFTATN